MPSAEGAHHGLWSTSKRKIPGTETLPATRAVTIGAMTGWRSVATVAAQPAAHVAKAGKPPGPITAGRVAPVESVTWRTLNGLYAAALLVEPPSTTCHSSRSATLAAVPGAPTP